MNVTKKKGTHKILKFFIFIVVAILVLAASFFILIFANEYKPAPEENISVNGTSSNQLKQNETVRVVTWNIGFGALGKNTDFFMDGGKSVKTSGKNEITENLNAIVEELKSLNSQIVFIQEIDLNSSRTFKINQRDFICEKIGNFQNTFANNFKCLFVPYPVPPIGKVDSGILTLSKFPVSSAKRIQLPVPFKFPVRACNLKRCLLVNRTAITGTSKELVTVNLHLEAYDDGERKKQQTLMLKKILEEESQKGNYVIAGGDFNQTFDTVDLKDFPQNEKLWKPGKIETEIFADDFYTLMDSGNPTCRSLDKPFDSTKDFQFYVIDGFIVSKNIQVKKIETVQLNFENSDHNPVLLEVVLTGEEID